MVLVVKNPPANAGDARDPWVVKTPWSRKWHPVFLGLEHPMDRAAWWATVHGAVNRHN